MFLKFSFFLLFNLFIINAFCQKTEWDSCLDFFKKQNLSYRDFERFHLNFKNKETTEEGQISIQNIYHRPLSADSCDYEQHLFALIKDKGNRSYTRYALNIISKENKIIYIELKELDQPKPIVQNKSSEYKQFIIDNQEDNNIPADTTHEYYNPAHLIFVGFNCREDGELLVENEADKLKKLIEAKNKTEILKWCCSLSPEIRCFGAIGLSYLKKNGLQLNDNELNLLEKISKEENLVYGCGGCIEGGYLHRVRDMFEKGKKLLEDKMPIPRA